MINEKNKSINNVVNCFPHLIVENDNLNFKYESQIKSYFLYKKRIISAINSKEINDDLYNYLFKYFNSKDDLSQIDVVKFWLNCIINAYKINQVEDNLYGEYDENIESLFNIIELLDSSLYENHYQNLNLVFYSDSHLNYNKCSNEFNYIVNIDFSPSVYLKVLNNSFKLEEIDLENKIHQNEDVYIPERFKNYAYLIKNKNFSFSFHYMSNGDVFILSKNNINDFKHRNNDLKIDLSKATNLTMIASRRNNNWYCYDNRIMEKVFRSRFNDNPIGQTLLKLAFELSHNRKGALIIFDIKNKIKPQILNEKSSKISSHKIKFIKDLTNEIILQEKGKIIIDKKSYEKLKVLMGIDGCVIFDDKGLVSAGSILSLSNFNLKHNIFDNITGARSAASIFSHELEGRVLKISQNGTISLYTLYYNEKIILEFL